MSCWFSGKSSWRSRKFWIFPGIMPNDEWSRLCEHLPLNSETEHLLSEIWPPNVELSFYQVHCSCQKLSQKNWFDGKVRLDYFYPLLPSIASTWIHTDVKRISQACCLHHLKNMEKNCKTQLWEEKQNRALFLGHPVYIYLYVSDNVYFFGHYCYFQRSDFHLPTFSFNCTFCFALGIYDRRAVSENLLVEKKSTIISFFELLL